MSKPLDPPAMDGAAFEEYLSRQSPVSQVYRGLDGDDVPSQLDEAVMAKARAALTERSRSASEPPDDLARLRSKRRRLMQWGIPTAIAASSLLVISIVIRSGVQHEVLTLPPTGAAPAASSATTADARPADPAAQAKADDGVVLIAPLSQKEAPMAQAPADKEEAMARTDQDLRETQRASTAPAAIQNYRAREEAVIVSRRAMTADQPAQAIAALPAPSVPSPPANEAAPVATAAPEHDAAEKSIRPDEAEELDEIAVTGYRSRIAHPSGPRGTVNAASGATSGELSEIERLHEDPEAWLEHIRQLRRDRHSASADREWRQFSKRYPDYAVAETDLARGKPAVSHDN